MDAQGLMMALIFLLGEVFLICRHFVYNPQPYVVENCVWPPIWSYWEGSPRIHSDQAHDASADPAIIVQRKIRHTNVETDILTSTLTL